LILEIVTHSYSRAQTISTDNEGRSQFDSAPTGNHAISIVLDNAVPLGLLDESPRNLAIPLRGEVIAEMPLNRPNQQP
jgi:hypothetical protein